MELQNTVPVIQLCKHYDVPVSFIKELDAYGLIEIRVIEREYHISETEVEIFEKIMRLHFDLDINLEGIDAIYNLLKQVEELQNRLTTLHNRLRIYED